MCATGRLLVTLVGGVELKGENTVSSKLSVSFSWKKFTIGQEREPPPDWVTVAKYEPLMILYKKLNCPSSWLSCHLKWLYPVTTQAWVSGQCNPIRAAESLLSFRLFLFTSLATGFHPRPRLLSVKRYVLLLYLQQKAAEHTMRYLNLEAFKLYNTSKSLFTWDAADLLVRRRWWAACVMSKSWQKSKRTN